MSSIGKKMPIEDTKNLQLQINHFNAAGISPFSPRNVGIWDWDWLLVHVRLSMTNPYQSWVAWDWDWLVYSTSQFLD